MPRFSSRPPHVDTLAVRRNETWFGTLPVTLIRGDQRIEGTRMGRYGGVLVYRPERDIDFGPERTHQVWSGGAFAELPDSEWERMGWTIVRQYNPTNRALARLRDSREDPHGFIKTGNLAKLDIPMDDITPDEIAHLVKVLIRIDRLRQAEPA